MVCSKELYNSSWICLAYPDRGWPSPQPWFLYLQQFNRSWFGIAYLEAALIFTLCLASFFANTLAVIRFYRRKVKTQLFYLLTALCICNCVFTTTGIILATSRISETWIFGLPGCAYFFGGSIGTSTLSMWVLALISVERCAALRAITQQGTNTYDLTTGRLAVILSVLLVTDLGLWGYIYAWLQIADTKLISFGFDEEPIMVCTLFTYRIPQGGNVHAGFILAATFGIPLIIIAANYLRILIAVRRMTNRMMAVKKKETELLKKAGGGGVELGLSSLASRRSEALRHRQRELFLVKLMACSLVLFVASHVPFFALVFYISNDDVGNSIETSAFTLCMSLLYVNAAINPLLQTIEPGWSYRNTVKVLISAWNHPLMPASDEDSALQQEILKINTLEVCNSPVLVAKTIDSIVQPKAILRPPTVFFGDNPGFH